MNSTDVDERRKQRYAGGAFLVGVAGMSKIRYYETNCFTNTFFRSISSRRVWKNVSHCKENRSEFFPEGNGRVDWDADRGDWSKSSNESARLWNTVGDIWYRIPYVCSVEAVGSKKREKIKRIFDRKSNHVNGFSSTSSGWNVDPFCLNSHPRNTPAELNSRDWMTWWHISPSGRNKLS